MEHRLMKRIFLKSVLTAIAGFSLMASSAMALPDLTLVNNGNGDSDSLLFGASVDGIMLFGDTMGGWDVTRSMGSSYPAIGAVGFPEMYVTGSTTSLLGAGSLTFTFTDTFSSWDSEPESFFPDFDGIATKRQASSLEGSSIAPAPEPATMLVFGAGLVGLAGVARRKKQRIN